MFSYYGSKSKIVKLYPPPTHSVIIEPFAGSARYALEYFDRQVLLFDTSPFVIAVWQYLLQASKLDILSLPDVPSKVSLDTYTQLTTAERYLIGFHLCRGKAKPRKVGHGQNSWARDKIRIAENLWKIKHWNINKLDYTRIPNMTATYFIDPPYKSINQNGANTDRYSEWNINYDALAKWIFTRKGQVIACENDAADYLDFRHLTTVNTNTNNFFVKQNIECVYLQGE